MDTYNSLNRNVGVPKLYVSAALGIMLPLAVIVPTLIEFVVVFPFAVTSSNVVATSVHDNVPLPSVSNTWFAVPSSVGNVYLLLIPVVVRYVLTLVSV